MKTPRFLEMPTNMQGHPFYVSWLSMKRRCDNLMIREAAHYSGRGISYCAEWSEFSAFYDDMFATWQPGLVLDRKDNNKGYERANCRWVSRQESSRNRNYCTFSLEDARRARDIYRIGGVTQGRIAKYFGVPRGTVADAIRGKTWQETL